MAAVDRDEAGLQGLKSARITPFVCDLVDLKAIPILTRRIRRVMGLPRVIVNNAGIHFRSAIEETTEEIWSRSLNVNLLSAATLCREFVPAMKRMRGAAIVNVASRNALSSSPESVTYDAAKAGLLAMTRTLAVELGAWGIRVNAVLPGFIATPIHEKLLNDRQFVKNYRRLIPLDRLGTAEEMANIIFFLASEQASFITGQGIVADGGQMCGQNYAKIFR